jgi:TATA-box binding protein (TBP) (component of TFIID and TFIIIB)
MVYSSIANQSFSFVLTVDEFRNMFPEETRPSWLKITTITMVAKFGQPVDLEKLREVFARVDHLSLQRGGASGSDFQWSIKNTTFYNQITLVYKDAYSRKSVKIFPNGSIQVAGCCDLFDCQRVIAQLKHIFRTYLDMENMIQDEDFRVVMINSNYSLNYNVNLMLVAKHFQNYGNTFSVSFQPDRYSAVKIKFKPAEEMKQITTSIFSTGKIIITGAETLKEVAYAYNVVCRHIDRCEGQIRVSPTEVRDVFNTFLGYECESLVQKLRTMGFHSWLQTARNNRINFLL